MSTNFKKIANTDTSGASAALSMVGGLVNTMSNKSNGKVSVGGKVAAGALSGAGAGAALGPIGIAAGALVGGAFSGFTASNTNKLLNEQEEMDKQKMISDRETMYNDFSKAVYNTFPRQGIAGAMMYGMYGGKLPKLAGGGLIPVSNTAQEVVGNTHEQGGVDVTSANGNGQAELENKEITYTDAQGQSKVLSYRLGAADEARKLMATPEYIQAELVFQQKVDNINKQLSKASNDRFAQGTLGQRLKAVKHPLDDLYNMQEKMKAEQGVPETQTKGQPVPKLAAGGTFGSDGRNKGIPYEYVPIDGDNNLQMAGMNPMGSIVNPAPVAPVKVDLAGTTRSLKENIDYKHSLEKGTTNNGLKTLNTLAPAISFVDNIYNAHLNTKRPPIPNPVLNRPVTLKTDYNIQPQLTENRTQLGNLYKNLDNTIGSPQVTAANKIMGFAKTMEQQNALQGQKANIETELTNKNRLNTQNIMMGNNQLINSTAMNKTMAKDDILTSSSENVANAVSKATMLIRQENMKQLDKDKLSMILAKYKSSGVFTRTEVEYIDYLLKG